MCQFLRQHKRIIIKLIIAVFALQLIGFLPFPSFHYIISAYIHKPLLIRMTSELERYGDANNSENITIYKNSIFNNASNKSNLFFTVKCWSDGMRSVYKVDDKTLEADIIKIMLLLQVKEISYMDKEIVLESYWRQGIIISEDGSNPKADDLKKCIDIGNNLYYFKGLSTFERQEKNYN